MQGSGSSVDRRSIRRLGSIPGTSRQDEGGEVVAVPDDEFANYMRSLSVAKEENMKKFVDNLSEPILPLTRVPERIVIVVDTALDEEEETEPFVAQNGQKFSCFDVLKRTVSMFVHTKASIYNLHRFALMFLNEDSVEAAELNFEKSPSEIVKALNKVKPCKSTTSLSLDNIFKWIKENATIFERDLKDQKIPPPYVVRVILIFTRSKCMPTLQKTPEVNKILDSPNFFFDILMSHGPLDQDNQCKEYFKYLTSISERGDSYAYDFGRNFKQLHEIIAKLLAHPLQRPHQVDARYDVPNIDSTEPKS